MPENRYFVNAALHKQTTLHLEDEEAMHLIRVMRKKVEDTVELVNGKNQLAHATISSIGKKEAELSITDVKTHPPPQRKLILAQGMTKPANLDLIIEKGTELGATEFWLFPGDKNEKKSLSSHQSERLHKISIAALKQCGRLDLPEIHEKTALDQWSPIPDAEIYFGDISEKAHPFPKTTHAQTIIIVIGPEGGFSKNEKEILSKPLNAKGIRFNSNILRTETAAICALSLFNTIN